MFFESLDEAVMLGAATMGDDALGMGGGTELVGAEAMVCGGDGVTGTAALFI